ncbi:hypothetical protein BKA69DRAFT_1033739 [Paraphysoderma sedebokerense]|nr:hypothetical protein BKA69DRAFT_1033739 [Paraphysoderma sedebokerense]
MQRSCPVCTKTVYNTEKIEVKDNWYHKGCFKCNYRSCAFTLNLKTFKFDNGQLFCAQHVPKPKATVIVDDVGIARVQNGPKRASEGLHKVTLSTLGSKSVGADSMRIQSGLNAPKKPSENLGTATKGADARQVGSAE